MSDRYEYQDERWVKIPLARHPLGSWTKCEKGHFVFREVVDEHLVERWKLVASCTSEEAARAALRLMRT